MFKVLLSLTPLVGLIHRVSAASAKECQGLLCVKAIENRDCGSDHTDVCTTLVLYNSTGHRFEFQGSGNLGGFGVKNIVKAEQVGSSGCYTLFKKRNQWNRQYQIKDIGTIHDLQKEDVESTSFKSIKYEQSCPQEAGLHWWGIVLPLLAVLLLGAGIFIVYRRKRSPYQTTLPPA